MTTSKLRVLGIDPGTATTGWAILEENNSRTEAIAYGHISTDKDCCPEDRLCEICSDLENIIKKYQPVEAAIEELFFFKNQKTIISVAQARGAVLLTLRQNNVRIASYTPLQIKQALTGYGRADKKQIQLMTQSIMGLKSLPKPDDTADAIAIALCHLNSRKMANLK